MPPSPFKETALHDLRLTTLAAQSTYNESQFALETLLNHVQPAYANRVDALLQIDGLSTLLREKEALVESLVDEGRERDERMKRVEREIERERREREEERTNQSSAKEKESLKAIEALQSENATLKTTIELLENQLGQLDKAHDEISREMEQLESRYASEKDVTAEQEKMSKYWQSLHDEAVTETKRLRDEVKTLQKEIDDEKQTRRRVEKELMSKDDEFRKYREQHDLAVEESNANGIETLREELAGMRHLTKESGKRVRELTQENEKMGKDNKALNAVLRDTEEKLQGITLASKDLERTNEQLKAQLDREKQMYSQLIASMEEERRNKRTEEHMKTPRAAPAKKASGRGNAKVTEPGEKSLFSTTPFLNKTVLLEDEEEESEEGDEERLLGKKKKLPSRLQLQEEEYAEEPKKKRQPATKKKGAAATKTTTAAGRGKKRASPSLDLALDGEDEDIMPTKAGRKKETTTLSGIPLLPPPTMRPSEPKKKKLLSQNRSILEDDDDDDDDDQRGGGLLGAFGGPKRAIKKTVRGVGAGGASRGGVLADFGTISPRKRSR